MIKHIWNDINYTQDTQTAAQAFLQLIKQDILSTDNQVQCYALAMQLILNTTCNNSSMELWTQVILALYVTISPRLINIDGETKTVQQHIYESISLMIELYQPYAVKLAGITLLQKCTENTKLLSKVKLYSYDNTWFIRLQFINIIDQLELWNDTQFIQSSLYADNIKVKQAILNKLFLNMHKFDDAFINTKLKQYCLEILESKQYDELKCIVFSNLDAIWDSTTFKQYVVANSDKFYDQLLLNNNTMILDLLWNPKLDMPSKLLRDPIKSIKYIGSNIHSKYIKQYIIKLIEWKPQSQVLLNEIGQDYINNMDIIYKQEKHLLQSNNVAIYLSNLYSQLQCGTIPQQTQAGLNLIEMLKFKCKQDVIKFIQNLKTQNFKMRMIYVYICKLIAENFSKQFYISTKISILDLINDPQPEVRRKVVQALQSMVDQPDKGNLVQMLRQIQSKDIPMVTEEVTKTIQLLDQYSLSSTESETLESQKQASECDMMSFDDSRSTHSFKEIGLMKSGKKSNVKLPPVIKTPRRQSLQLTVRPSAFRLPKI